MGRGRRWSASCYPDLPISPTFSRKVRRKSLPQSTIKEIEVSSAGTLHCDRPQVYQITKFEQLMAAWISL
jgi:hypothetical protein